MFVRFALQLAVSEIQCQKLEMHQMTPNWNWTFNSQKYPVYTKYFRHRPKFSCISLYGQQFSRYKVDENRKCTEWYQMNLNT